MTTPAPIARMTSDMLREMREPSLAHALPQQQERCRGILESALEIGPAGLFLVAILRQSLARAERAAASGDVAEMLAAYKDLKGYKE